MNLFRTIALFLCAGTLVARAELPSGWDTNYNAGITDAAAAQEPVLLYFTASWCGPCKLMSKITLSDPAIMQALSGTRHVAIDLDENGPLAAKRGINSVPTFLLLLAGGNEVERATGFQPANDFLQWLTNGLANAREAAKNLARLQSELLEVDRLLSATNSEQTNQLAQELFDLCAARDPAMARAVATRLQTLAARDPAMVLAGLKDPRLATRIAVANVLRAQFGESFDVDVWSDASTRAKAVEKWNIPPMKQ